MIGINLSTIGKRIIFPMSTDAFGSFGFIATAVSPNIVSGLVVATVINPEPSSNGYLRYHIEPSTSSISTSSSANAVIVTGSQLTNLLPL